MKKYFIFDFDGTLADTFYVMIEILNNNKEKYGIDGIDPHEIPRLKNMSVKYLLQEFNINILRLPTFLKMLRADLSKEINLVKPFSNIVPTLEKLKEQGIHMGVLTSNTKENVDTFNINHAIDVFDFVHSEKNLFGKHKVLNKILKQRNLDPNNVYYIGDEIRDVEAAKKAGLKSIAVSWGYNSEDVLKKYEPNYLIHKPLGLLDIAKSL
jgi:phosphoglycolate phosphatase